MRLGVIGDIHQCWDRHDTGYFNACPYDALVFVGDLPRMTGSLTIARELARLDKPVWLIPGNHDAVTAPQLLAELKGWHLLRRLAALGMRRRVRRLSRALGPVRLAGFELAPLAAGLALLVGRPHAMGPNRFYYRRYLAREYGVASFTDSAATLKSPIAGAPQRLVVLAHNGPAGRGATAAAPWGCDFSPEFGDFGDPDLSQAISHAQGSGRHVQAVIAGHMHHGNKRGGLRRTAVAADGVLYLNAARVPRHCTKTGQRHYIALSVTNAECTAATVWVDASGRECQRSPLP